MKSSQQLREYQKALYHAVFVAFFIVCSLITTERAISQLIINSESFKALHDKQINLLELVYENASASSELLNQTSESSLYHQRIMGGFLQRLSLLNAEYEALISGTSATSSYRQESLLVSAKLTELEKALEQTLAASLQYRGYQASLEQVILLSSHNQALHKTLSEQLQKASQRHLELQHVYLRFKFIAAIFILCTIAYFFVYRLLPSYRALKKQLVSDADYTKRVEEAAITDELTKVKNRLGLRRTFQRWETDFNQEVVTCYIIDLNHFKPINDKYGHEIGDKFLIRIAQRLQTFESPKRHLFRLGGDEFCILDRDASSHLKANILKKQIETLVSKPIPFEEKTVVIGCSVGYSISHKKKTLQEIGLSMMLTKADDAMYNHKKISKRPVKQAYS